MCHHYHRKESILGSMGALTSHCAPLMGRVAGHILADRAEGSDAAPLQVSSEVAWPWPVSLCGALWEGHIL